MSDDVITQADIDALSKEYGIAPDRIKAIVQQVEGEPSTTGRPDPKGLLQRGVFSGAFGMGGEPGMALPGQVEKATPRNPRQLVEGGITTAAGLAVPAGRTIPRQIGSLLAPLFGGGVASAVGTAMEGGSPMEGVLPGAMNAIPQALLQTGVNTVVGPSRATIRALKQIHHIRGVGKGQYSDNVMAALNPDYPQTLYHPDTIRWMDKVAGNNLNQMEYMIEQALGPMTFPSAPGSSVLQSFREIRANIKRLRTLGDPRWAQAGPDNLQLSPERIQAYKREAGEIERHLIDTMRQRNLRNPNGGLWADDYMSAITQYVEDKTLIRYIKAEQQAARQKGGANPIQHPAIAQSSRLSMDDPNAAQMPGLAYGMVGAAGAAKGHSIFAGHQLGRFFDSFKPRVSQIEPGLPPRWIPGAAGGFAPRLDSLLGTISGTGVGLE